MLQIALQMLFQLYYTVYCIIRFSLKLYLFYGNIIAKPAGQLGQQGFACNANLYAQVPVVGVPVCLSGLVPMLMPSANKIKNEIKKVEEEWCKLAKMKKNNNHGKVC